MLSAFLAPPLAKPLQRRREQNNEAGVVREWWCHVPTSFWFIAERNTVTDEILKTYPAGDVFKDRVNFAPRAEQK